ncbi:MAG: ATP-dependent DNA helicase RecG [Eubacteriales bacterium]|nr:ATP-dependent DNA helicase RecG [Eubacteriales bacterium]
MQNNTDSALDKPVSSLKGVGEARKNLLNGLGIFTVADFLYHFPRLYEDRRTIKKISELVDGETCSILLTVKSKVTEIRPRRNLTIQKIHVGDDTGSSVVTWFNRPYLKKTIFPGNKYIFYGKIARRGLFTEVQNPSFEKYFEGETVQSLRILPIYPLTAGLTQNVVRNYISDAFRVAENELKEFLPEWMIKEYSLEDYKAAMRNIHFPENDDSLKEARRRLVFQELLILQLGLLAIKNTSTDILKGLKFKETPEVDEFIGTLPFKLTHAQLKVYQEIKKDMESDKNMNRLIQGDVGSGKTVVAVLAMLKAYYNGYQVIMMAPTEILAEQHFRTITNLLKDTGVCISILTGSTTAKDREAVLEGLSTGRIDIIIGTHALIQGDVIYKNPGLVITDEQHRFGVRQRAALKNKGGNPDVLVMTATPIPRTLALILYGDLDISVIDEMPPGRRPVKTYSVDEGMRERINEFVRNKVREGRQVYIICPLVDESESIDANSAVQTAEKISKGDFRELRVELVHGKMKSSQKEKVIKSFIAGEIDILVSTTVIEEGIDVPNAALMIIENAERFGLAQLHQLRGRVGRGIHQSYCILYNQSDSQIAKERIKVMESSNDGFFISSKDLELRGPGEFFGTRQHGIPEMRIANLYSDIDVLREAQDAALKLLKDREPSHSEENGRLLRYIAEKVKKEFEELSI